MMNEGLTGVPTNTGVAQASEYRGNTNDLIAFTAAVSGLSFCAYLATNGLICCLPAILGAAGLAMAKDAADPHRARVLSILGIASVGVVILLIAAFAVLGIVIVMMSALASPTTFR